MARVQVLDHHDRGGEIRWQGGENVAQGREPPGRGCQGDDVESCLREGNGRPLGHNFTRMIPVHTLPPVSPGSSRLPVHRTTVSAWQRNRFIWAVSAPVGILPQTGTAANRLSSPGHGGGHDEPMPQGGAHRWDLPVAQSLRNHLKHRLWSRSSLFCPERQRGVRMKITEALQQVAQFANPILPVVSVYLNNAEQMPAQCTV